MSNIRFTGVMPAMLTPFNDDGSIKKHTVKAMMDYHYAKGVKGFYINGSTGEGPSLSLKTRLEMSETVMENNGGRGVIIEHVGAPCYNDAVELVKHADKVGVDAISSLAPNFYFSFTDDEIVDYYRRIASFTDKPLIVYVTAHIKSDVVSLVRRLMEIPTVIGLKYTLPDYFLMRKLCELNGGDINIINGPDEMLICGLIMGAQGCIGSTYNVMPDWFVAEYNAAMAGDWETARQWQYKINRVIDVLLRYSENGAIKGVKAAMTCKGFDMGNAVYPSKVYTSDELAALKKELAALGIEFDG